MPTINYTASQFAAGFTGPVSLTKNPDRIYFVGGQTIWVGRIKGSYAVLNAATDWGAGSGVVLVSIDGGELTEADRDGSGYVLFSGEEAERLVCVCFSLSASQNVFINSTGNVLTVEGDDVGVTLFADRVQFGEETDYACFAAVQQAAPAEYLPSYLVAPSGPLGTNVASARVRGEFTELAVVCGSLSVYVSIDGGTPTKYPTTAAPSGHTRSVVISGLSGELATYNIWTEGGEAASYSSVFAIYGDAEFQNIGTKKRIWQFGDRSTSGGMAGSTRGDVETMLVAAHFGYAGTTVAVSWHTTANVSTAITTALAGIVATEDDVAILAVGRNEGASLGSYQECVEKLLAGGFGTVLCRGVLPEGDNVWPDHAATIQNVIATIGDPRVHFIDTSTWQPIDRPDGTHPTPEGFLELAEFAKVGYAEFLSEESGNEYSHTAEGGLELDGAAGFSTVAAFAASGGVSLGGSAIWGEAWDQSHTGTGGLVLGGSAGFSSVSNFQVSGGLNLGGRAIIRLPSDGNAGKKDSSAAAPIVRSIVSRI